MYKTISMQLEVAHLCGKNRIATWWTCKASTGCNPWHFPQHKPHVYSRSVVWKTKQISNTDTLPDCRKSNDMPSFSHVMDGLGSPVAGQEISTVRSAGDGYNRNGCMERSHFGGTPDVEQQQLAKVLLHTSETCKKWRTEKCFIVRWLIKTSVVSFI